MGVILITGIAGGLARQTAFKLRDQGHQVVGVDYRTPFRSLPDDIKVYRANYNKTIIEDIFKAHPFDTVLHLGRVGNLKVESGKRFDLNVVGTQKIMNLCVSRGVRRLVVLSTFHIYGAHPKNHTPISEDDPLSAGFKFPQIADAIQLDNLASQWVYRHPEVCTSVLRATNIIGPDINNTMSTFLRKPRVPYVLGFDPMMQFIHQDDLSDAIVAAISREQCGIFNVAGDEAVPWRTALHLAGAQAYPLPAVMALAYHLIQPQFPRHLVDYFKYPCIIDTRRFKKTFDWTSSVDLQTALQSTVAQAREEQLNAEGLG